jgi:hypothetical protein
MRAAAQAADPRSTVDLQTPATDANVEEPTVWAQIIDEGSQTIRFSIPGSRYQTTIDLAFSTEQLSQVLASTINDDDWETVDLAMIDADIGQARDNLVFLRHHTWQKLAEHTQLTVAPGPFKLKDSEGAPITQSISFDSIINVALQSDLAREMVRHGFLTPHFALYTSSYYGNHLGPDAMEYTRRCIEPGEPDMTYEIGEDEVVQILREQGAAESDVADLFTDASTGPEQPRRSPIGFHDSKNKNRNSSTLTLLMALIRMRSSLRWHPIGEGFSVMSLPRNSGPSRARTQLMQCSPHSHTRPTKLTTK